MVNICAISTSNWKRRLKCFLYTLFSRRTQAAKQVLEYEDFWAGQVCCWTKTAPHGLCAGCERCNATMGEKPARGREPSRRRRTTGERSGQLDWSQLEPFEEGRAGDLPNDDRALFGDFASQLLEGRRRWHQRDVSFRIVLHVLCLGTGRHAAAF